MRKIFRIIGLLSVIGYMSIIMYTWIDASLSGYTYFAAGEPDQIIKYTEWIFALIGIVAALDLCKQELDKKQIAGA